MTIVWNGMRVKLYCYLYYSSFIENCENGDETIELNFYYSQMFHLDLIRKQAKTKLWDFRDVPIWSHWFENDYDHMTSYGNSFFDPKFLVIVRIFENRSGKKINHLHFYFTSSCQDFFSVQILQIDFFFQNLSQLIEVTQKNPRSTFW